MSKLAKKPIILPEGVQAEVESGAIKFTGKEGTLSVSILEHVKLELKDRQFLIGALAHHKQARANRGTLSALIKNAILGVSQGFTKTLEIEGIGFRAQMEGVNLLLNIGFTHPVKFVPPAGIKISVEKSTIKISGVDKKLVGETAAQIRKLKKPEPYKGKGIRYSDEVVRRKAGKKVAGVGTTGSA